jgi:CheY-like chemotaxis protein
VEAQAAKRDSDERLKDGMAAAKMLVWDWNLATGALEFSDNVTLVLGFNPERMEVVSACIHPEDQEEIKKAHAQALAESGSYQEIVRFNRPDTGKPEMDCYELARRLRADPANRRALFIALTGYGQAHDKVLSRSVGFEHHFVKPMDTDRLRQLLNAVVR